jgi:hypothetical protein
VRFAILLLYLIKNKIEKRGKNEEVCLGWLVEVEERNNQIKEGGGRQIY